MKFKNNYNILNKFKYSKNTIGIIAIFFAVNIAKLENLKSLLWSTLSVLVILLLLYKKAYYLYIIQKPYYKNIIKEPILYLGILCLFGITSYNWMIFIRTY